MLVLGLLLGLVGPSADSGNRQPGAAKVLDQEHPQQPTPPFPTLIPTQPLPTLPPSVPTPAPQTPTTTLTPAPQDTPVTPTITPTPTATEPSATPSATSFLGLEQTVFLPWLGLFAEREEPEEPAAWSWGWGAASIGGWTPKQ
jgi:hypothetical protein